MRTGAAYDRVFLFDQFTVKHTMHRREFHRLGLSAGVSLLPSWSTAAPEKSGLWADIEADTGARLGVAILDTGSGALTGHRLD